MALLLLLACAHVLPAVDYDPAAPARATPLVGPASVPLADPGVVRLRNAAGAAVTVYAVDVVPPRAARVRAPRLPARVEPGETLALDVDARARADLLVRTSAGVRLVALTTGDAAGAPTGVVERAEVATAVEPHLAEVGGCYSASLAHTRGLTGRVRARVVVAESGEVVEVALVDSTLPAGEVEACVVAALAKASFPASTDRRAFVYPFVFAPR